MKYSKISVVDVKVKGSILFGGKTVHFNLSKLPKGLVSIEGDNGDGKSSLLSLCTPHPKIVGKPTKRDSSIWQFFNKPDSEIRKIIHADNEIHEHIITIKGAHTKSPKVECFLNIDGVPVLELCTFDSMFEKTQELYGSYEDYLTTTFYIQPLQGGKDRNIIGAPMTEIRNIVQNIAGIDYSKHKEFALKELSRVSAESAQKEIESKAFELDKEKINTIKEDIQQKKQESWDLKLALGVCINQGKQRKESYEKKKSERQVVVGEIQELTEEKNLVEMRNLNLRTQYQESMNNWEKRKIALNKEVYDRDCEITKLKTLIHEKKTTIEYIKQESIMSNKKIIDEKNLQLKSNYQESVNNWEQQKIKLSNLLNNRDRKISDLKNSVKEIESLIAARKIPCEYCGKLSSDNESKIKQFEANLNAMQKSIVEMGKQEFEALPEKPTEPKYLERKEFHILSDGEKKQTDDLESEITVLDDNIVKLKSRHIDSIPDAPVEPEYFTFDKEFPNTDQIDQEIIIMERTLEAQREEFSSIKIKIARAEESILNYEKSIVECKENIKKGKALKAESALLKKEADDWQYISKMLSPDKIPAIELETIIDAIDNDATDILKHFLDGRYSMKTATQIEGKKKTLDKFDILIHDSVTGKEKSFHSYSPGERSFPADAYTKALIKQRIKRSGVSFSPIIADEIDGPISAARVGMFYKMQKAYYNDFDTTVLTVTHSSDSQQYIDNSVYVNDYKE